MIRKLIRDAQELAKARSVPGRPPTVRGSITQDAYRVLILQRLRETAAALHVPVVPAALRMAQTALLGIEIGKDVTLGEGVNFIHTVGIVIGGNSKVGNRVTFYGNNTLGTAKDVDGYPTIEDDVSIGAGARILGGVTIGARSTVGANAVVLANVPPDSTAVGIPARSFSSKQRSVVEESL